MPDTRQETPLPVGSDESSPVHPPRQERSRKTLERIARAARELIAERGVRATTVQEIVDRADSSVGSFYARFDSRDDLLRFLEERVWRAARDRWDEAVGERAWEGEPLRSVLEGVVGLLVRLYREDAGIGNALGRRGGAPAGGSPLEEAFHGHVLEGVRALVLERDEEVAHPDPARAVEIGYRWVVGGIRELTGRLEDETLAREVARGWRAYLGGGVEKAAAAPEDVDFFDPWG